jgi:hypothetical protein
MYEELVKRLREAEGWRNASEHYSLMKQAADAIKELQAGEKKFLRNISALEMENENLKRGGRWIPVTERLPEDERNVLVCYGFTHDGVMTERRFMGVIEYFAFDVVPHWQHESTGLTVTHWMPLPTPPKEET